MINWHCCLYKILPTFPKQYKQAFYISLPLYFRKGTIIFVLANPFASVWGNKNWPHGKLFAAVLPATQWLALLPQSQNVPGSSLS